MSDKQLQLHIRAVILLILSMLAIAMMGEVYSQNWDSRVTAYPTKTEAAIETYAKELLAGMTTEEKVGQMFFAVNTADSELASELRLGGVLLSDVNLEGLQAAEVKTVVSSFQAGADIPLFIGAVEEGGVCNTVSKFPGLRAVPFLSPDELMTTGGMGLVESDVKDKCDLLHSLGINLNFAPVCDVVSEESALLYGRALGRDADATARYVEAVVKGMEAEQMVGVLKHFPGYGNLTAADAVDERSMEAFETADILPFRQGLDAGAEMVMMGNFVMTAADPNAPACLSRDVHRLLRRSFGFDGVIISDDLSSPALKPYGSPEELAVKAVQAGSDMLLTSAFETQIPAVVDAVHRGEIAVERIDESVLRILKLKIKFGILT